MITKRLCRIGRGPFLAKICFSGKLCSFCSFYHILVRQKPFKLRRFKSLLSDIFSKMDVTGDGKITISDFEKLFEDEERLFLDIA